jgi:hypothetical protein
MSWKSEVDKKGRLFAFIGLAIGFLFGIFPDWKTAHIYGPGYLLIKAMEGLLFGFILGVLFGTLNHLYQKSPGPRPPSRGNTLFYRRLFVRRVHWIYV